MKKNEGRIWMVFQAFQVDHSSLSLQQFFLDISFPIYYSSGGIILRGVGQGWNFLASYPLSHSGSFPYIFVPFSGHLFVRDTLLDRLFPFRNSSGNQRFTCASDPKVSCFLLFGQISNGGYLQPDCTSLYSIKPSHCSHILRITFVYFCTPAECTEKGISFPFITLASFLFIS